MSKILMHRNDEVCELNMAGNTPISFGKVFERDLLPIGTDVPKYKQDVYIPNTWYAERSIPMGRMGLENITKKLGFTPQEGFLRSMGVSLTDCYWIKDTETQKDLTWEDVNYHDNGFEPTFSLAKKGMDFKGSASPDFTTAGVLEKYWVSNVGKPFLLKTAPENELRVIANEIVVSYAAHLMGIDAVKYDFVMDKNSKYCGCPCFIDSPNEDLIFVTDFMHAYGIGRNAAFHILKKMHPKEIGNLVLLDCLFMQEDRHGSNVGMIISPDKKRRFAPIYDSGNCLGCNRSIQNAITFDDYKLSGMSFEDTLDSVSISVSDIPIDDIQEKLKYLYEKFNISEEGYESSLAVLNYGYEMVMNRLEKDKSLCEEVER